MTKTIGGFMFLHDGERFDYCYKEAIHCLCSFCDKVSVVNAGSTDDSGTHLDELAAKYSHFKVTHLTNEEWLSVHGKTKLAHFQNIACGLLDTDYQLLLQADEVLTDDSFLVIKNVIELEQEAFFCTRINLWKTAYQQLNVPQDRKPCSTEVIRLTKRGYLSYDDGENISVPTASFDFLNEIKIIHYGFVRLKEKMKKKAVYIQDEVFGIDHDKKLDVSDDFIPEMWFGDDDLLPFSDHPKVMLDWIKTRP